MGNNKWPIPPLAFIWAIYLQNGSESSPTCISILYKAKSYFRYYTFLPFFIAYIDKLIYNVLLLVRSVQVPIGRVLENLCERKLFIHAIVSWRFLLIMTIVEHVYQNTPLSVASFQQQPSQNSPGLAFI